MTLKSSFLCGCNVGPIKHTWPLFRDCILKLQFALGTSISQILLSLGKLWFALSVILLADNLPYPSPLDKWEWTATSVLTQLAGKSTCPGQLESTFLSPAIDSPTVCKILWSTVTKHSHPTSHTAVWSEGFSFLLFGYRFSCFFEVII